MKIYLESTIPSYAVAENSRDIIQQARIEITKSWWANRRKDDELFISQAVIDEISLGEEEKSKLRINFIKNLPLLEIKKDVYVLAEKLLSDKALPIKASDDAIHIAIATINKMDLILTWNFKHIANAYQIPKMKKLINNFGCKMPMIITPEEINF